jgi:hypothetical protein
LTAKNSCQIGAAFRDQIVRAELANERVLPIGIGFAPVFITTDAVQFHAVIACITQAVCQLAIPLAPHDANGPKTKAATGCCQRMQMVGPRTTEAEQCVMPLLASCLQVGQQLEVLVARQLRIDQVSPQHTHRNLVLMYPIGSNSSDRQWLG